MQLIVLGMHRSGTSVLARLLNLMGAYFGPEGISTGANKENPKGFWERKDVRALNDFVLHTIDCDWNRISSFDLERIPPEVLDEFLMRASKIVLEMDAHRPWFLKEPRLCLLLPLWLRVLESPICIHIYRPPSEVAASLRTRNQIPIDVGLALWQKYVVLAQGASAGIPGAIVAHRDLMTNPMGVVSQLQTRLESHGVRGLRVPVESEITAFVNDDLYREREHHTDLLPFARAPQNELYNDLLAGEPLPDRFRKLGRRDRDLLAGYESGLPPLLSPAERRRTEVLRNERARDNSPDLLIAIRELGTELGMQRDLIVTLKEDVDAARAAAENTAEKLYASDQGPALGEAWLGPGALVDSPPAGPLPEDTAGERGDETATRIRNINELARENVRLRTALAAKVREVAEQRRGLLELRAELKEVANAKTSYQENLQSRFEEIACVTEILSEAEAELEKVRAESVEALRKQKAKLEQTASESVEALRKQKAELEQAVSESVEALRKQKAELEQAVSEHSQARRNWEEGRKAADIKNSEALRGIQAQLEQVRAEREKVEQELVQTRQQKADELATVRASLSGQTRANAVLEMRINATAGALEFERGKVKAILRSNSWRMTASIRRLAALFTRSTDSGQDFAKEEAKAVIEASGMFDGSWYLRKNHDVLASGIDPLVHYLTHGAAEGRDPNEKFDAKFYLSANPDVSESGLNPLFHYIQIGAAEGRATRVGVER